VAARNRTLDERAFTTPAIADDTLVESTRRYRNRSSCPCSAAVGVAHLTRSVRTGVELFVAGGAASRVGARFVGRLRLRWIVLVTLARRELDVALGRPPRRRADSLVFRGLESLPVRFA
jgi:hypothetical protein